MNIKIHPEPDLINVTTTGEFSLQEAKRTFLEMLEEVARCRVEKVIFDGRSVTGEPKTIDRFYYGEFAAFTVFDSRFPNIKFAYILIEPVRDPRKLGEMAAVNRGMQVKVFDNPEDARKWLEVPPTNQPNSSD